MTLEAFLSRLEGVTMAPGGHMGRCPAHEDHSPSLSIAEGDKTILIHCHAGCQPAAVLAAAGLEWADLSDRVPRFWK